MGQWLLRSKLVDAKSIGMFAYYRPPPISLAAPVCPYQAEHSAANQDLVEYATQSPATW